MDGTTIGPYRITGLIGQGGMGSVYAAEHTLLGRQAAIKVLHPEMSVRQDVVVRFFNEARAATAIRHPGIVEIYDFGWTAEQAAYIVMERLHGEALGDRQARAPMKWPHVLSVARQIAGALGAAHGTGIIHRDLKPDNIFLVPDPEVPGGERIKLLDFGIAKLAGDAVITGNVTRTGAVMGTPTYMAPEQCRGVVVDHRADLYALGCIMFELCCGRPPFVGEGSGDVLAAHIHVPVPAMATFGADVPPTVEAVIQHLLTKSPQDRVASAEALIQAIDRVLPDRMQMLTGPQARMSTGDHPRPVAAAVAGRGEPTTLSGGASSSIALKASGGARRWMIIGAGGAVAALAVIAVISTRGGAHAEDAHKVSYSEATATTAKPAVPAPVAEAPEPAKVEAPTVEAAKVEAPEPAKVEAAKVEAAKVEAPAPAEMPAAPAPAPAVPAAVATDVSLETTPPGATVLLGGLAIGKTPLHTSVSRTGDATLIIRLSGYADHAVAFHAGRAITQQVALTARPPAKRPPPRTDRDKSVNPFGD